MHNLYNKIGFFLLMVAFSTGCENDLKIVQDLGKKNLGVERGIEIESFLSQNGKMKARLAAPLMLRYLYDTPRIVFTDGLKVDFYDSSLMIENQLSSKFGQYKENENKVFLKDSIVVYSVAGDTLWTEQLFWDQDKETFFTETPTTISKNSPGAPRQKIYAEKGILADQNFKWFILNGVSSKQDGKNSFIMLPDSTY